MWWWEKNESVSNIKYLNAAMDEIIDIKLFHWMTGDVTPCSITHCLLYSDKMSNQVAGQTYLQVQMKLERFL